MSIARTLPVTRAQTTNGLTVLLCPDPSAPLISLQTWYRVGSRHETPGKTGIAHLFEHLMFNETQNLPAGSFDRKIEAAGGDTNAATWVDWTYYTTGLPASRLDLALELESERMGRLVLGDAQVDSEREVVANERRLRVDDDVDGLMEETLYALAFEKHPYHWPTIGWMKDILGLSTQDCLAFYARHYSPRNATLVLAGDFDPTTALARIEKHYGSIPADEPPPETIMVEPPQTVARRTSVHKPMSSERLLLALKAPAQGDPAWLPLSFCAEILSAGASSRLHKRLVVREEAALFVHGHVTPFAHPGLIEFSVAMHRTHDAAYAEAALTEEFDRLATQGPTENELRKVRNRLETGLYAELETASGKAETIGHYETTLGRWDALLGTLAQMATLTAADVKRAAATYLAGAPSTIVVGVPSAEDDDSEDEEDDDGDMAEGKGEIA